MSEGFVNRLEEFIGTFRLDLHVCIIPSHYITCPRLVLLIWFRPRLFLTLCISRLKRVPSTQTWLHRKIQIRSIPGHLPFVNRPAGEARNAESSHLPPLRGNLCSDGLVPLGSKAQSSGNIFPKANRSEAIKRNLSKSKITNQGSKSPIHSRSR